MIANGIWSKSSLCNSFCCLFCVFVFWGWGAKQKSINTHVCFVLAPPQKDTKNIKTTKSVFLLHIPFAIIRALVQYYSFTISVLVH
jgi:hypothetical protein